MTATITRDFQWDSIAHVERPGWLIEVSDGRRKRTRTRTEAREWCAYMGITVVAK